MNIINLDHISANPLIPEVKEAIINAVNEDYANPMSQHKLGEKAARAIAEARTSVARLINAADDREIVFVSCGTESVNHAVKGIALANADRGKHIVTTNVEHNAVNKSLRRLKSLGYNFTSVPVDENGRVDPKRVQEALTDETILISVMLANNEVGTLQPVGEIAEIAKEKQIPVHTDAVDAVGVIPVDVQELGVSLASFAANPFYGPTGVGGLYIRRGTKVFPLLDGGVQEHKKRAGTENILGIIGMGVAAEIARKEMPNRLEHFRKLREKLIRELPHTIDDYFINGDPRHTLPNLVSISLKYIEGESIILMLDDENVAASTRSACATGSLRSSHVLQSMGLEYADAQGTLIVSFGVENTETDIEVFLGALKRTVKTLRDMSPLYHKAKKAAAGA